MDCLASAPQAMVERSAAEPQRGGVRLFIGAVPWGETAQMACPQPRAANDRDSRSA